MTQTIETIPSAAAKRLRAWRKRLSLNLYDAGTRLGFPATYLSRWERGDNVPSLRAAFQIQDATGIPARSWVVP